MKKSLSTILIGILAIILVLSFTKNAIVKVAVEKGVESVTGLKLHMKSLNIGVIKTLLGITDLKLYNPRGFEDKVMLDMPEIYVNYDLPAIIKGNIHLEEVRINLKEFVVVKNANGELNLDSLKVVKDEKAAAPKEPAKKGKAPKVQIDSLTLKIGKVVYKDYSKGGAPSVQEFNINLNEKYENITDPNKLVSLIVVRALMNTSIAKLAGFDLQGLQGTISDTLAGAQKVLGQATEQLMANPANAGDVLKSTANTLKETTEEGLGSALGSVFGGAQEEEQK